MTQRPPYKNRACSSNRRRYVDYRSIRALISRLPLTDAERDLAHIMTRGIWEGRRKDGSYDIPWLAETMRVSQRTAQRALRTLQLYGLVEPDGWNGSRRRFQLGEPLLEAVELPTDQGVRLLTDRHLAWRSKGGRPRVYESDADRKRAWKRRQGRRNLVTPTPTGFRRPRDETPVTPTNSEIGRRLSGSGLEGDETLSPLSENQRLLLATKGYGTVASPGQEYGPPQGEGEVDVKEGRDGWDEEAEGPSPEQEEELRYVLQPDGLEAPGAVWLDLLAEDRPRDLAEDEPLEMEPPDDWFWAFDVDLPPDDWPFGVEEVVA